MRHVQRADGPKPEDVLATLIVRSQRSGPRGWKKNSAPVPMTSESASLTAPAWFAPRTKRPSASHKNGHSCVSPNSSVTVSAAVAQGKVRPLKVTVVGPCGPGSNWSSYSPTRPAPHRGRRHAVHELMGHHVQGLIGTPSSVLPYAKTPTSPGPKGGGAKNALYSVKGEESTMVVMALLRLSTPLQACCL